jgi:hypothetical protein
MRNKQCAARNKVVQSGTFNYSSKHFHRQRVNTPMHHGQKVDN